MTTKPKEKWYKPTKKGLKQILEIPLWLFGYLGFLALGGYFMVLIEGENDKTVKNNNREALLQVLDKYGKMPNDTMVREIIEAAVNLYSAKGLYLDDLTAEVGSTWGMSGGIFFCATTITTIGYGDRFPVTTGGRWFTIIYALIGIPFTGVILAKIGIKLTELIKKLDNAISKPVKKIIGKMAIEEKVKFYVRIFQLFVVFSIFLLLFWFIPAIIMAHIETDWDYITAIYFCFITITTIGLGDITPGSSTTEIGSAFNAESIHTAALQTSTLLYFVLGLSALSIILNLVKAVLNVVALTAKTTAEDFSNKGMKLMGNMTSSVRQKISISGPSPFKNNNNNNNNDDDDNNNNKPEPTDAKSGESMIDQPISSFALENILEEGNEEEEEEEEGIFNMAYEEDKKQDQEENSPESPQKQPEIKEILDETASPNKAERTSSTTLLIPPDGNEGMPSVV